MASLGHARQCLTCLPKQEFKSKWVTWVGVIPRSTGKGAEVKQEREYCGQMRLRPVGNPFIGYVEQVSELSPEGQAAWGVTAGVISLQHFRPALNMG